jgi:hypothetical protein
MLLPKLLKGHARMEAVLACVRAQRPDLAVKMECRHEGKKMGLSHQSLRAFVKKCKVSHRRKAQRCFSNWPSARVRLTFSIPTLANIAVGAANAAEKSAHVCHDSKSFMKAPDVRQIKHRAVEEESRKLREFQDAPSSVAVERAPEGTPMPFTLEQSIKIYARARAISQLKTPATIRLISGSVINPLYEQSLHRFRLSWPRGLLGNPPSHFR